MKTISDLNALIPQLKNMLLDEPAVGTTFYGRRVSDHNEEWEENYICYDEDGWDIEINYKCTGELTYSSGDYYTPSCSSFKNIRIKITKITVSHYDEKTEDETHFDEDEIAEFIRNLEKIS